MGDHNLIEVQLVHHVPYVQAGIIPADDKLGSKVSRSYGVSSVNEMVGKQLYCGRREGGMPRNS